MLIILSYRINRAALLRLFTPHPSSSSRFSISHSYKSEAKYIKSNSDFSKSFSNVTIPELQISLQLLARARSMFSSQDDVVSFLRSSSIAKPAKGLLCSLLWELRRDWESAVLVFRWAGDGAVESPWAWDLMIWVLGEQRRFDLAWVFLRRMHRKSILTRRGLVIMMERYVSANETGKAIRTFHALEKFNIKADLDAFYALLRALCKNKNIEEAEELLLSKRNFFPLETVGFNILLDGWCNILVDLVEAKRIWREMAKYCITPDSTSYTHMIGCMAKHGNLYDSVRLYDEMKKRGCIPNLNVYNYLIYVLTKENCMKEAHSILNKIMEEGLKPDLETYNCMIFSLCETHKLDEAREIMKTMMSRGIRPSMDTYHAFIKMGNFEGMFKLIERMKEDGIRPNRRTFLLIFDNFFGSGESESALKMWSEMSEYDITPDIVHYITMIKGLILHGWIPKAVEFYGEMKAKGFPAEPELEKLFKGIFSNKKSRWGRDIKRYITRNY